MPPLATDRTENESTRNGTTGSPGPESLFDVGGFWCVAMGASIPSVETTSQWMESFMVSFHKWPGIWVIWRTRLLVEEDCLWVLGTRGYPVEVGAMYVLYRHQ